MPKVFGRAAAALVVATTTTLTPTSAWSPMSGRSRVLKTVPRSSLSSHVREGMMAPVSRRRRRQRPVVLLSLRRGQAGATSLAATPPKKTQLTTTSVRRAAPTEAQDAPAETTTEASHQGKQQRKFAAPIEEIERRKNVAIISHPDAGKTSLTEKLLLYGDAIQEAGAVRARNERRKSRSDFLAMEKERGISISSTCLTFEYLSKRINLMDTPGHADFSEDTYRTLSAADNAVMLIDGGKGLESQTKKLFSVARRSGLPVFTFINKMDRPSLSPWDVCDEISSEFKLECAVRTWPVGSGDRFKGVYEAQTDQLLLYEKTQKGKKASYVRIDASDEDAVRSALTDDDAGDAFFEDREMIRELTPPLDRAKLLKGEQTAVFFGSAITDAGVAPFLEDFVHIGATPMPRKLIQKSGGGSTSSATSDFDVAEPSDARFAAFVFKLQANLNPKHRDSMAYVRVVSGKFERGLKVTHGRTGRVVSLNQASFLFGSGRDGVDAAYPGDVLGVPNPAGSLFHIGDALYTGTLECDFEPIPSFSPECFAYVRPSQVGTSYKSFHKGLEQLLSEGAVTKLLIPNSPMIGGVGGSQSSSSSRGSSSFSSEPLLAAVGQLQFDVVQDRLKNEYGVDTTLEPVSYTIARWVRPDDLDGSDVAWRRVDDAKRAGKLGAVFVVADIWHRPVLLFRNEFTAQRLESDTDLDLKLQPWALPPRTPPKGSKR